MMAHLLIAHPPENLLHIRAENGVVSTFHLLIGVALGVITIWLTSLSDDGRAIRTIPHKSSLHFFAERHNLASYSSTYMQVFLYIYIYIWIKWRLYRWTMAFESFLVWGLGWWVGVDGHATTTAEWLYCCFNLLLKACLLLPYDFFSFSWPLVSAHNSYNIIKYIYNIILHKSWKFSLPPINRFQKKKIFLNFENGWFLRNGGSGRTI